MVVGLTEGANRAAVVATSLMTHNKGQIETPGSLTVITGVPASHDEALAQQLEAAGARAATAIKMQFGNARQDLKARLLEAKQKLVGSDKA